MNRRQLIAKARNYLARDGVILVNGFALSSRKLYEAQCLVRDLAEALALAEREIERVKE